MTENAIMIEKLDSAVSRLLKKLHYVDSEKSMIKQIQTDAVTMKGAVSMDFYSEATNKYIIKNYCDSAYIFFDKLIDNIKKLNQNAVVSLSPISEKYINAVYIPAIDTSFVIGEIDNNITKCINMHRFIDDSLISKIRSRYRFAVKCRESLWEGALDSLSYAGKFHFALEKIYVSAMDFEEINKKTDELMDKIHDRFEI